VRREVLQRDFAAPLRHAHAIRQVPLDGIVERDQSLASHVRKQRGGERLRDRPDLEDRARAVRQPAAMPEAGLAGPLDTDHEPGAVHAGLVEHRSDAVREVGHGR
jgi:hypothetical protein